jgi:hypothetical protein
VSELLEAPTELLEAASPKLLVKLADAAAAVSEVEKDKRNTFHKYDYSSIEAVVKACRMELLNRRVLVTSGLDHVEERERQTRDGASVVTTAHLIFTVFDAETGESLQIPWAGQGDDPADKGLSKAISDARKTFLLVQLNLARGDDTEADEATDERTGGGVNLLADAKGLSNAQLNAALVASGLPAQQQPFGTFTRIPAEKADLVRESLRRERAA